MKERSLYVKETVESTDPPRHASPSLHLASSSNYHSLDCSDQLPNSHSLLDDAPYAHVCPLIQLAGYPPRLGNEKWRLEVTGKTSSHLHILLLHPSRSKIPPDRTALTLKIRLYTMPLTCHSFVRNLPTCSLLPTLSMENTPDGMALENHLTESPPRLCHLYMSHGWTFTTSWLHRTLLQLSCSPTDGVELVQPLGNYLRIYYTKK